MHRHNRSQNVAFGISLFQKDYSERFCNFDINVAFTEDDWKVKE